MKLRIPKGKVSFLHGSAMLISSRLVFLGSGYAVQIVVATILSADLYGLFGIFITTLNFAELIFSTGILRNVTALIAKHAPSAAPIIRRARVVQYVPLAVIALVFLLFAEPMANALHAPELTKYIRLLAVMFPLYGTRSFYSSILAGLKRFPRQSVHRIIASVIKLSAIPLVYVWPDLYAIILAYFAAATYLLIAYRWEARSTEEYRTGEGLYPLKPFMVALLPMLAYTALFPMLNSFGLYAVKGLLPDMPKLAGYYTGAVALAQLPALLLGPLGATLLPSLSTAFGKKNRALVHDYASKSDGAYILLLVPFFVLPISALGDILDLMYPSEYRVAFVTLGILLVAFPLIKILRNGLLFYVASEKYKLIAAMFFILPLVHVGALWLLVPTYQMAGAALATGIVALVGFLTVRLFALKDFGIRLPVVRFLKTIAVAGVVSGLGFLLPWSSPVPLLSKLALLSFLYVALLLLFRIPTEDELGYPKRLFKPIRKMFSS